MQWKIYLNAKQLVADVNDEGNEYRETYMHAHVENKVQQLELNCKFSSSKLDKNERN